MILTLALAAVSMAPPAPSAGPQAEIVVLGRKLATWRGNARVRNGRYECKTKNSSGDPRLDRIACSSTMQCMGRVQPKVDALLAGRPPKKERERLFRPINAELAECAKAAHAEGLRQLAAEEEAQATER